MRFITATLFLALASNAIAQQSIEGTVLNATTGTPVSRAQVAFRRTTTNGFPNPQAPGFAADTNSEGKFELTHIEPGSYSVEVQRSGFVTQQYKGQVAISAGNRVKGFDFKLIPQAVVAGRVLDQDGAPLSGMEVLLLRPVDLNGKQQLLRVGFAQTNDAGEFRIAGLAAGRYLLGASNQNAMQIFTSRLLRYDFDKPQVAFAKTYFPSSTEESSARPIDLTPSQNLSGLEIRMKQERVFRVRGKLVTSTPIRELRVEAAPRNSDRTTPLENKEGILNEDGTFEIARLFPGPYTITAMMATGNRTPIGKTQIDITQNNVDNVIVSKIESVTVAGTIRIEGSFTAKKPTLESIQLSLFSPTAGFENYRQAKPDALGSFQLENVVPGKFRLGIQNLPDGLWLKSARAASASIINSEFEIPSGPIEIALATGVGTISGGLTNLQGQPAQGSIILQSEQTRPDLLRNIPTDQNGRFKLPNIAPGEYTLYAVPPFEAFKPPSREATEAARSKARKITIEANSQAQVDLTLAN